VAGLTGAELTMIRGYLEVFTPGPVRIAVTCDQGVRGQLLDLLQVLFACWAGAGSGCDRPHAVAPPNTTTTTRSGLRVLSGWCG